MKDGGRERGREGGREGGKEGGREGEKERGREGGWKEEKRGREINELTQTASMDPTFPPSLVVSIRKRYTQRGSAGRIPSSFITAWPLLLLPNLLLATVIPSFVSDLLHCTASILVHNFLHCYIHKKKKALSLSLSLSFILIPPSLSPPFSMLD